MSTALNPTSAGAAPSRTDVRLEASDVRLTLSPDVLELGSRLAASALEPLMQVRARGCQRLGWAGLGWRWQGRVKSAAALV